MVAPESAPATPGLLVISRHRVALAQARAALEVLAAKSGCISADIARSTDDYEVLVVETRWATVGDYRRALSSYEVKVGAVPLLATAVDETTAFEVLYHRDASGIVEQAGALAERPERNGD